MKLVFTNCLWDRALILCVTYVYVTHKHYSLCSCSPVTHLTQTVKPFSISQTKLIFCNKMAYFIKINKTEGTALTIIIVYENLRTKGLSLPLSQTMVPDDQDNLELASIMCLS